MVASLGVGLLLLAAISDLRAALEDQIPGRPTPPRNGGPSPAEGLVDGPRPGARERYTPEAPHSEGLAALDGEQ